MGPGWMGQERPQSKWDQFTENDNMNTDETIRLPLWKRCLEDMLAKGFSYGTTWPASYFEAFFKAPQGTMNFAGEMIPLRQHIEKELGYYIGQRNNGQEWFIPDSKQHEACAHALEADANHCLRRSIVIRCHTLDNPAAHLDDTTRQIIERGIERAQIKYALLRQYKRLQNSGSVKLLK